VLATAIGTFAIPICKDFLDDHPKVAALFTEVPVDWILVPSYGDETTVRLHTERARKVARFSPGATTVVANQRNVEVKDGAPCPGFAFLPLADRPEEVGAAGGQVELPFHQVAPPGTRVPGAGRVPGSPRHGLRLAAKPEGSG
jgi:hypothetical protein